MNKRLTCFVSGRVQGVGFRHFTQQRAKEFSVTGTVENLIDGRVKIVVEGAETELLAFLDAIEHSTRGHISQLQRFQSEATGEFDGFKALW